MKALDLIYELEQLGVRLWCENGALKFEAPKGVMNADRVNLLKTHKHDLLAHLSAGQAPIIEPLDHANDSHYHQTAAPAQPIQPPERTYELNPSERLKQRAMAAYEYLLRQSISNLAANGYSDHDAMVYRQDWRSSITRVMHIPDAQIDRMERELIQDGVLAYAGMRTYLLLGHGLKQHSAYTENPDFILADDSGRTFANWLYS